MESYSKNELFPSWTIASSVLNNVVDKYYGVYVWPTTDTVNISFLSIFALRVVPYEYSTEFTELVSSYTETVSQLLDISATVSKIYRKDPRNLENVLEVRKAVQTKLDYSTNSEIFLGLCPKETLKGFLGIEPYYSKLGILFKEKIVRDTGIKQS